LGKGLVPLKVFSGGIEEIPAALDYVRQGKNSGEKVVVTFK
jgi:NADPH-dependent curcumin reductase CurA